MKVLTLSDIVLDRVYSPQIRTFFNDIEMVIGCGDLPHYYLEYIVSMLDVPVYHVRGNHTPKVEYSLTNDCRDPGGAIDLHRKVVYDNGLLLAGIEGCLRYRAGPFMYTQNQMWKYAFGLVPQLLRNKLRYGRFLDIFVTHASPWGIHDQPDRPHWGIKAFLWLDKVFQPAYHFHGHIHIYRQGSTMMTLVGLTNVINTYGYRVTEIEKFS